MGSSESVLKQNGYTLVKGEKLVKNKNDDLFAIKKLRVNQEEATNFYETLSHPHIVQKEEIITDTRCLYLVLELCEGGDLTQKIKLKKEKNLTFYEMMTKSQGDQTRGVNAVNLGVMENTQILDWTVKICMALKHLHDQQILHKNLQPKSIFFTACGTIRLGEFGQINEWSADTQTTQTEDFSYVAPEKLNSKSFDEKSEIWSLGCIIYEMCMLKRAFTGRSTREIFPKILNGSYDTLPNTISADLRQLVEDTLQVDPVSRPCVSEILTRPFVIKHLYEKSKQTIKELKVRNHRNNETTTEVQDSQEEPKVSLKVLDELADGLESVHYKATVGSLAGGVVGLAGGILSIVGLILTPFTLGVSLIVTGVGIGVGVAGGVAAGASNVTKMVNERSNRQNMKMLIREIEQKITSTCCCIQMIQIAENLLWDFEGNSSLPGLSFESKDFASAGARLGRGLGGIPELIRLTQAASAGKAAAQTARVVRVADAATGVLSVLFVAVDIAFIALDAKEIHKLRQDYASMEAQGNSFTNREQEFKSEIMKFVKKIRDTTDELETALNDLEHELMKTHLSTGF